ncbi:NDR1 HIN1 12 [Olea europaea subsp. europaea]|uniref:NDR1 HIN1 12 n=1 Tax=Olea europaea subsp. europaea TaxID=158383 RepID=A0A8S0UEU5_OLEEU|nr:NDR1 HIN1 12 [Olea europaea subsp. europaea]
MPKPVHGPRHRTTSPFIWCVAIICNILTVAVIIARLVVFIGYLVIRPKVPLMSVSTAQLNTIYFDETSLLTVQVTIVIKAENDNVKAHASFYNTRFAPSFHGVKMAYLVAKPSDIRKNSLKEFNYVVQSSPIPLEPEYAEIMNWSLRRNVITFELKDSERRCGAALMTLDTTRSTTTGKNHIPATKIEELLHTTSCCRWWRLEELLHNTSRHRRWRHHERCQRWFAESPSAISRCHRGGCARRSQGIRK